MANGRRGRKAGAASSTANGASLGYKLYSAIHTARSGKKAPILSPKGYRSNRARAMELAFGIQPRKGMKRVRSRTITPWR